MHALYLLKFSSGKCYVGQTVRTMNTRLQQHRAAARRGSELPVHCAWRKHGEPEVQVLGEFDTPEQLHRAEIEAIARLGTLSPGGYNVGLGGETSPAVNPDVAQKIAKRAKGRKHADTSAWSEATRKQWQDSGYREKVLSAVMESFTDERRAALSDYSRAMWERRRVDGWTMPEEVKAKLRGRKFSEESRAKMSASAKGKKLSEETKAKIGAASSARKYGSYSEERRRKTGDAVKAAWADPVKRERLMAARKAAWETRRRKQQEQPV
jgi:hypothetical protein